MKVTRRRALFHRSSIWRRPPNLYWSFVLIVLLLVALWVMTQFRAGAIRSPFEATPTATRTANSYAQEGQIFFEMGNLNAAIASYQQAVNVEPENAEVWAELARIQAYSSRLLTTDAQRLKRLTEALQSADQAVALAPQDSTVHAIRAFVLDWNANPALDPLRTDNRSADDFIFDAEQEAVRALALDGNNALALAFYAEILVDQQKWTQAEAYIQQALERGSSMMDIHRVYAQYLESIGNYRLAIEEYQKAIEVTPNLTFLYISVGQNYRALALRSTILAQQVELYDLAIEYFSKAARINDLLGIQDPLPYVAIARVYAQQGEFFAASRNALKAIEIRPDDAELYGVLGAVYDKARNFEAAIDALKCVVQGCTAAEACAARGGCPAGDAGTPIKPLPLTDSTRDYYLIYGNRLAAFSPVYPSYCVVAVNVLTQVRDAYRNDPVTVRNADDGLAICAFVSASQQQSPTPYPTSTPLPTPRP